MDPLQTNQQDEQIEGADKAPQVRPRRWRAIALVLVLLAIGVAATNRLTQASLLDQATDLAAAVGISTDHAGNRPGRGRGEDPVNRPAARVGQPREAGQPSAEAVPAPDAPDTQALTTSLAWVASLHEAAAEHASQAELVGLVRAGEGELAFEEAFELGDELFETKFNALDGVGANVGNGARFTQVPRADLNGPGQWATHFPLRITGPNAEACNDCHGDPFDDGAGPAADNNARDPLHSGDLALFIQRQTPHVFAPGAVQRLAEEMTADLHAQRDAALADACASNGPVTVALSTKGVDFGTLTARPDGATPCVGVVDTSGVAGVDSDLMVKPFQWKGTVPTIRAFNRDAAHQELGMQAVEIVGEGRDGDFDGVTDEFSVGDQTVLAVYLAAQPRPTTLLELNDLGLIDALSDQERAAIVNGELAFHQIGCASCHMAQLTLADPIFSEPSLNPDYRDVRFPAGQDPVALGVDPAFPIQFDLTQDQPDNLIETADGVYRLGSLVSNGQGGAIVGLYGDLKRHDLGPDVAEPIADDGIAPSVFLTENLWGVGTTAPYLHDGRATTLAEAILAHGGEAASTRSAFTGLPSADQASLIAFLENLVLFKAE